MTSARPGEAAPKSRVPWPRTHRLISAHHPAIHFFDDIADPADWELLARAAARTDPKIYETIGDLGLVPVDRRVSGEGAGWVMGAFTHVSPDRASRFSDGSHGIYYAADSMEAALCEHAFHMGRFFERTKEPPGWLSQARELIGAIDSELIDLRGGDPRHAPLLDPDPARYATPQGFAAKLRNAEDGIVYPSLRYPGGACVAAFWPDVVTPPREADHFRYHWTGTRVDLAERVTGARAILRLPAPA